MPGLVHHLYCGGICQTDQEHEASDEAKYFQDEHWMVSRQANHFPPNIVIRPIAEIAQESFQIAEKEPRQRYEHRNAYKCNKD